MQGERVLNLVEFGWRLPLKLDGTWRSTRELKSRQEWDKLDNESSKMNARALYNIFNKVSPDEFRKIGTCKCAKEAWDILSVIYEGTLALKLSKIWMLTSKFESKRM